MATFHELPAIVTGSQVEIISFNADHIVYLRARLDGYCDAYLNIDGLQAWHTIALSRARLTMILNREASGHCTACGRPDDI